MGSAQPHSQPACQWLLPQETAAAGGGAAAEATAVSFLTPGGGEVSFLRYAPLIEDFQAANPTITIDPTWEPGGAIEIQTKLLTLIAVGDARDSYWAHIYTNSGQAVRNIQLDINPFIDADDDISGDDFLLAAYKDFPYEGRQIGFPRETTSTVIIYNAEFFEAAGMPRPYEGWTWADFVECATMMTQGEGSDRIYGTADWQRNRNTWIKMWQKGGDVLSEDRTKFTMNQEPGISQVLEIQNLQADGGIHLPATVTEAGGFSTGDLFTTGRIGMIPQFSVFIHRDEFRVRVGHRPSAG